MSLVLKRSQSLDYATGLAELCEIQQKLKATLTWSHRESLENFLLTFCAMSEENRRRARYELDSNMVFSSAGPIDFSYVASSIKEKLPDRSFAKLRRALPAGRAEGPITPRPNENQFFAVLTDVDDTLLPSADALGFGGCDKSWRRDGTLYPGIAALHRVLRGRDFPNNQPGSRGYSVCLTARPAALIYNVGHKCRRLGPRLAILPGSLADSVCRNKDARYGNYARSKVEQFHRYARWFRDEDFVFFGDCGQGDLKVSEELLATHAVAFCAIHVIAERSESLNDDRQSECPEASHLSTTFPSRFFFYSTTHDLATQLERAGWISTQNLDLVRECYARDLCEEAHHSLKQLDLRSLQDIVATRTAPPDLDEWEMEQVDIARRHILPLFQLRGKLHSIAVDTIAHAGQELRVRLVKHEHVAKTRPPRPDSSARSMELPAAHALASSTAEDATTIERGKSVSLFDHLRHLKRHLVQSRAYCTVQLLRGADVVHDLGRTATAVRNAAGVLTWAQDSTMSLAAPMTCVLRSDRLVFTIFTEYLSAEWTAKCVGIAVVPIARKQQGDEEPRDSLTAEPAMAMDTGGRQTRLMTYLPDDDTVENVTGWVEVCTIWA